MKLTLRLVSGAIIALTLGILFILIVNAPLGFVDIVMNRGALMPGGQGYMLVQLVVGLIAACLVFLCSFRSPGKPVRAVASFAAILAIIVSLADVFWLPVVIVFQSLLFLWFQYRRPCEPGGSA